MLSQARKGRWQHTVQNVILRTQIPHDSAAIVPLLSSHPKTFLRPLKPLKFPEKNWLEIEPIDWFAHHHLSHLYLEKSRIKEGIVAIEKALELSGSVPPPLAIANAVMTQDIYGDKKAAERFFDDLKERAKHEYIPPICFAYICLTRGDMDSGFEWVKKAHEERDSFLPWLRVSPMDMYSLKIYIRINELLDRLELP